MTFSDETVMAYVDGELDEAGRAAIEAALARDADLARRIQREQALRTQLRGQFDNVLSEPLPQRLRDAVQGDGARAATVTPLRRRAPAARWSWPQWGAMAASLAVGALLAPLLGQRSGESALQLEQGRLVAAASLSHALDTELASTTEHNGIVRVGISFVSRTNQYCRTFVLQQRDAVAGLACRDPDGWRLLNLAATAPASGGAFRQAASSLPASIAGAADDLIDGQPLDAAAERAAQQRGWRR